MRRMSATGRFAVRRIYDVSQENHGRPEFARVSYTRTPVVFYSASSNFRSVLSTNTTASRVVLRLPRDLPTWFEETKVDTGTRRSGAGDVHGRRAAVA